MQRRFFTGVARLVVPTGIAFVCSMLPLFAGGNLVITGHDDDLHRSPAALKQIAAMIAFARQGAKNAALPILIFDVRNELTTALELLTTPSSPCYVRVDPETAPLSSYIDATKYSAIGVASDENCGGCDNTMKSSTNIKAARTPNMCCER